MILKIISSLGVVNYNKGINNMQLFILICKCVQVNVFEDIMGSVKYHS